ncbi:3-keto-disaccharide hydrolase [Bremerella sp. P1]|uniref:3-keto-disaccharide hydrolase n=1 Tax=Bremerella sp. P1 TaxID=3026424 RepID=UPI002368C736|nr:DUF1080 domain-containing protein [Bremerella sp. P1]WDI43759.1 DUF1080 domain-containing protein [Bremerella sp. P1]
MASDSDQFTPLFNGKDLAGWSGAVDEYVVLDGTLRCKPGKSGTLYSREVFGNFVVRMEFKLPPGGNNGVAIRYPGSGLPSSAGMCEIQILDNQHPKYAEIDARQVHGSAYGMIAAKTGFLRPVGQWNFQEITVTGSRIKVELNGTVILDGDLSQVKEFMNDKEHPGKDRREGHLGLAGHRDPVAFRNIVIKRLP